MEILRPCLVVATIFLISSSFLPQIEASSKVLKNQADKLNKLFKQKYFNEKGNAVVLDDEFSQVNRVQQNYKPLVGNGDGLKEDDKIEKLPGQPPVKFAQYGGYVAVDEDAGRAFYYYFVEAENKPQSAPLLLWLNGGPGCSSLAYGAMAELGPFRVHSDGKTLSRNNYAWNKVANVLFVESPAGVGFSYSNRSSDYSDRGDKNTAQDNLIFVINWLERFPEYKKRDFFISGESYAGHYVPQLAHNILQHNKIAPNKINLKGIIIGNAVINDETDSKGMYEYYWTHALISDQLRNTIMKSCDFSPSSKIQSKACSAAADETESSLEHLDIYNIYAPICLNSSLTTKAKHANDAVDPCYEYYTYAYLNNPLVQEALHANVTKLTHDWEPCSDTIKGWSDSPSTIIPLLREFMTNGLRVWVFSGDTDGRVPVTSTRNSLNTMKLKVKTKWYPWFLKREVGGFVEVYEEGLTFVTVRGSGRDGNFIRTRRTPDNPIHIKRVKTRHEADESGWRMKRMTDRVGFGWTFHPPITRSIIHPPIRPVSPAYTRYKFIVCLLV